jgi:glycosyltransferase involved in cell wall biosynthesis
MHNLRTTQIELVAGSEWQYRQAQESAIFKGKNMHKILAAVDPEMYRPGNNVSIRERMGVPSNSKVLLFGAAYLDEKRKGYDHFVQVLSQCASNLNEPEKDLLFAIILGSGDSSPFQATGIKYIHCGFTPANELPDLYRAADLYICCSTQDSGPTMINQSIMSGTPVLAYEMGVALDLVIDGETGFRVPLGNIDMMAKRLLEFLSLDAEILDRISKNCRAIGLEKCEPSSQMKAIANIIN